MQKGIVSIAEIYITLFQMHPRLMVSSIGNQKMCNLENRTSLRIQYSLEDSIATFGHLCWYGLYHSIFPHQSWDYVRDNNFLWGHFHISLLTGPINWQNRGRAFRPLLPTTLAFSPVFSNVPLPLTWKLNVEKIYRLLYWYMVIC